MLDIGKLFKLSYIIVVRLKEYIKKNTITLRIIRRRLL